jgi:23S rRNA (uracil1939-C5)-methyltransferase
LVLYTDIDNPFDISCTHFGACSGCVYPDANEPPKVYQDAKEYFAENGVALEFIQGKACGFRSRAKLAVRLEMGALRVGLFKEGTHEVLDIPRCKVHHPRINEAVALLKACFFESGLSVYDEKIKKGDLRYIQCIVETATQKVSLSVVVNGEEKNSGLYEKCKKLFDNLSEKHSLLWHSFWINFNNENTNTIFSSSWKLVNGADSLWEKVLDVDVPYGPSHFGQSNLPLFNRLVGDIKARIHPSSSVCEFYAGMGVIGVAVSEKCRHVCISEREASCATYFEKAKAKLTDERKKKVHFSVGSAEQERNLMEGADVVIVDPPRKGLDSAFLETLSKQKSVQQLFYVSCHFASLKRDCEYLKKHSRLKLKEAKSYLFFPGTDHIEILALFDTSFG